MARLEAMPARPRIKVAIIGAGVIGTSVAFACAKAGYAVHLIDREGKDWSSVKRALRNYRSQARFTRSSDPLVDIDEIAMAHSAAAVEQVDLVIENVSETWAAKQAAYKTLSDYDLRRVTIACNTSAIPISRLAALTPDPSRVIGVHFMNPVDRIGMVEIVRGAATSDETLHTVLNFLAALGKRGIVVGDQPGFVINRVLMLMISQAAQLLADGAATVFEIDQLFKGCLGHAMGPLRTADLIGIDTIVNTLKVLEESYGGTTFRPAQHLVDMVESNDLGVKTGRGFYTYDSGT